MPAYEPQIIKYEHHLDRAPTLDDKRKKVGMIHFLMMLREEGWADDMGRSLKSLEMSVEGIAEEGNHRMIWTAKLV